MKSNILKLNKYQNRKYFPPRARETVFTTRTVYLYDASENRIVFDKNMITS